MSLLLSHRALLLCVPHLKDAGSDGLLREASRELPDVCLSLVSVKRAGAAQVYSHSRQPHGAEEGERGSPS